MIFWDTSAVIPLVVRERSSNALRELARSDPDLVVWWGTPVEAHSAITRRSRAGGISPPRAAQARDRIDALRSVWTEIQPAEDVREVATLLVLRHPLRAADALQLAAALAWSGDESADPSFATLDERLARAARGEGFSLPIDPAR